jgi:hypothetical protein
MLQNPRYVAAPKKYAFILTVQYLKMIRRHLKNKNSEGEGREVERKGRMCAYMYEVAMGNLI